VGSPTRDQFEAASVLKSPIRTNYVLIDRVEVGFGVTVEFLPIAGVLEHVVLAIAIEFLGVVLGRLDLLIQVEAELIAKGIIGQLLAENWRDAHG